MEARAILARAGAAELAQKRIWDPEAGHTLRAGEPNDRRLHASAPSGGISARLSPLWIQRPHLSAGGLNPPIHTLPSAHYEPLRHQGARLSLTGFRLVSRTPPWGFPYFVTSLAIEQYA